ncbi:MAG: VanZ family protein [Nitrospirae bacterium]|nr:VanZ family protein [Nitrospirota bacterium]
MKILFYTALIVIFILAVVPNYNYLPDVFSISDLLNHFMAFFMLSILFDSAYRSLRPMNKMIILFSYGLFIEIVQYFVPYRDFSFIDLSIDGLAVSLYFLIVKRFVVSP